MIYFRINGLFLFEQSATLKITIIWIPLYNYLEGHFQGRLKNIIDIKIAVKQYQIDFEKGNHEK